MRKKSDLTGKKFGKLTVIEAAGKTDAGAILYKCKCDCGGEKVVRNDHLKSGAIQSCGCIVKKQKGLHNTKLYSVWSGMKKRCHNPKNFNFKNYGGRGVSVCDEWRNDFLSFYKWAIENGYKEGLAIDRIDNDRNYEPSNCRWVTPKVNGNNRRTSRHIEYNGRLYTIPELAELFSTKYEVFYSRLYREGFSIEKYIEKYGS